tara:strand:+ start:738 stop:890 length:153 start_codon:yes stop_codon:yes gene_type:complete
MKKKETKKTNKKETKVVKKYQSALSKKIKDTFPNLKVKDMGDGMTEISFD